MKIFENSSKKQRPNAKAIHVMSLLCLISIATFPSHNLYAQDVEIDMGVLNALGDYFNDEETKPPPPSKKPETSKPKAPSLKAKTSNQTNPIKKAPKPIAKPAVPEFTIYAQPKKVIPSPVKVTGNSGITMPAVPNETVMIETTTPINNQLSPLQRKLQRRHTEEVKPKKAKAALIMAINTPVKPSPKPTMHSNKSNIGNSTDTIDKEPRLPPGNLNDVHEIQPQPLSIPFDKGNVILTEKSKRSIQDNIVNILKEKNNFRIQIQSFASKNDDEKSNQARRKSLSRALNIRSYLLKNDILASRIDVRALGAKTDTTPYDRADFVFLEN